MKSPRIKLTAVAAVLALVSMGLLGGPPAAGAATVPSDTVDEVTTQYPAEVDLSEIPEGSAEALSCYGNSRTYTSAAGSTYHPTGYPGGSWFATRGDCNDINMIIDSSQRLGVRVCFHPRSGGPYCQSSYTGVAPGQWTVLATNVAPGTAFKLQFNSGLASNGRIAT